MMTKEQWVALRPKRAAITAALEALGFPLNGWANDRPDFVPGYNPDWADIEKIATSLSPVTKKKTWSDSEKAKPKPKNKAGGRKQ